MNEGAMLGSQMLIQSLPADGLVRVVLTDLEIGIGLSPADADEMAELLKKAAQAVRDGEN